MYPPGQPSYGQPQPAYGQPAYGQPAYGQPAYGQPTAYAQPSAPNVTYHSTTVISTSPKQVYDNSLVVPHHQVQAYLAAPLSSCCAHTRPNPYGQKIPYDNSIVPPSSRGVPQPAFSTIHQSQFPVVCAAPTPAPSNPVPAFFNMMSSMVNAMSPPTTHVVHHHTATTNTPVISVAPPAVHPGRNAHNSCIFCKNIPGVCHFCKGTTTSSGGRMSCIHCSGPLAGRCHFCKGTGLQ
eukprot:TRINITY_DN53_c1_g1_i1.p1 TRINITY_DN53_c1_g1~~TRINITY_DN53_c1_g1_i1.p1  ORF type:complete len:236 (-),score=48.37 TRINITY_DN53_c1_g1_i1:67-774(-)